ncbi:MAG: hypothetical protein O3C40_28715 [Planctomycetota bacterium]|nr:hypothetical protein [Planctomycetota bacterium]
MSDEFDPYYAWLGIPPKDQPANHYRLLGVELFETNLDVIESAAFRQMGHVRTYQSGKHSRESQQLLNELSAAKICLLNPQQKEDYDQQLRATIEAITAFLPDETIEQALPVELQKPAAESVHVIDFEPGTGPSDSAVARRASVSAIRRKRPRPVSRVPIVVGVIVVVVCLGIAVMFGSRFLQRENPVAIQPSVPPTVSPPVETKPAAKNDPPNSSPIPANDSSESPPSAEPTQNGASTPNNANSVSTVPSTSKPVLALNESTRRFAQFSPQMMQSRLRIPLASQMRDKFEEAAGIADNEFAFAPTMPYDDFLAMVFQLRNIGYRPLRVRPYLVSGESRVASVWTRDAIDWRMVLRVDSAAVEQADQTFKPQGFRPVDVACWQADGTKFAAVWAADPNQTEPCEFMLGVSADAFAAAAAAARTRGLMPLSHHVSYDGNGEPKYSVVWRETASVVPWHHWDGDRETHESALKRPGAPQDVFLGYQATGELTYGGLSVGLPDPNALELHGYDAENHRDECRNLVSQGYRPIAIAAASPPGAPQSLTASVWQRDGRPTVASPSTPPSNTTVPTTSATAKATHALRFDGRDSITIANSRGLASTRNSFTAEMWFRFSQSAPQPDYVLMGTTAYRELNPEVSSGAASGWYVAAGKRRSDSDAETTALRWADAAGGIIGSAGSTTPPLGSDWHHLAVCNSPLAGGTWRINVFLDGRLTQSSTRSAGEAAPSPSDFFLGVSRFLTDRHSFHGDIKAFRLSSSVRYQDTFSPPTEFTSDGSTLSLLNFNGTPPSNVLDLSGNSRHGVVAGADWVSVDAPLNGSMAAKPEPPPAALAEDRMPVPSKDERDAGSKKVKDIFATDFEAAKDEPAKLALARELLQRGKEEQDATAKFALLYESRALMLEAQNS